ncbi:CHAD domain-containing protein [Chelatococcus sp. GCM10030263]|uniref:CHAD domain-containing protein n=1 Tax=Chelatococcus sp. GCM10030263 TaxID=3273387 RepID=UPI00360A8D1C
MLDQSPTLACGLPSEDAFRLLAGRCLAAVETEAEAFVATEQPDALHRTRVALRRVRAILSLFKELVGGEDADAVRRRLGEQARILGVARNCDVYLAETLAPVQDAYDDLPGLAGLEESVRARRQQAYDAALDGLRGGALTEALAECRAWLLGGAWTFDPERADLRAEPVEAFAARVLRRWRRRIRRNGRHLAGMDGDTRHRLRIAAKKLRYAAELFAELFPGREARSRYRALVTALRNVQDHLGRLNDTVVAYREVDALIGDASGPHSFAAGFVAGRKTRGDETHLTKALAAYERFAATKPFWKA